MVADTHTRSEMSATDFYEMAYTCGAFTSQCTLLTVTAPLLCI